MLRLSVDENPLKLQLLLELFEICQLHIGAGWTEIWLQFLKSKFVDMLASTCLVGTSVKRRECFGKWMRQTSWQS